MPTALKNRQAGFTLIELITVIVILGIIAVIGSQFIVSATESYRATQSRALLANTGRQAVERMTRQLRGALPYSVRVTNGGDCVQFMPIAASGFYLQPVPSSAINSITTSPYCSFYEGYDAAHIVIGALSSDEIYTGAVRAGRDDISLVDCGSPPASYPTTVEFNSQAWPRNSVSQRFYLVSNPQAFCLSGSQLQFYQNLNPSDDNVSLGNADELLARNAVSTGSAVFTVNGATADNNIIVNFDIRFSEGGESVDFFQEVSLRNVP